MFKLIVFGPHFAQAVGAQAIGKPRTYVISLFFAELNRHALALVDAANLAFESHTATRTTNSFVFPALCFHTFITNSGRPWPAGMIILYVFGYQMTGGLGRLHHVFERLLRFGPPPGFQPAVGVDPQVPNWQHVGGFI
ncbi:hypothetical protein LX87_03408 [Larkinella arboricola]|uniref:Uncharacterized protein n=1 Tax=Larkinella arboricola TaxID=643671 RepID=A0A327WTF1_LARAB|nr:hypothetical protein LX87_03408 [Larkinella arboricola]